MLGAAGILQRDEVAQLRRGLSRIRAEIDATGIPDDAQDEDIFSFVERRLGELIGDTAGRLHTARSRNDQVATDFRLYIKGLCRRSALAVCELRRAILGLAGRYPDALTAGMTHLQIAQPVLFAHQLLAYDQMLQRDLDLFAHAYDRADVLPLGAGALAGVPYPIAPELAAKSLGFARIAANSMDAVSDRDFVLDYLYAAAMTALHVSRIAEDVIIQNSQPFGAITIDDRYATGSSLMPQKKNPDVAELARGKAGRIVGTLAGLMATLKGLPLTYNLDLQEDKEAVFGVEDSLLPALETFAGMMATLKVDPARMAVLAAMGNSAATDLADYLVAKGLPFRKAHAIVAGLVRDCERRGITLAEVELKFLKQHSAKFAANVMQRLDPRWSVNARTSPSGTAPARVHAALASALAELSARRALWEARVPSYERRRRMTAGPSVRKRRAQS